MKDKAILQINNTQIETGEVYEGMIYLKRESNLDMVNSRFKGNLAHQRAMISTHYYSFFELDRVDFEMNEAVFDTVAAYVDTAA